MNIKQFLKPDWRKIAVFVILFAFETLVIPLSNSGFGILYNSVGLPLIFYEKTIINPSIPPVEKTNFSMFNFIIDFVILYLISCLLIWFYDNAKKKK